MSSSRTPDSIYSTSSAQSYYSQPSINNDNNYYPYSGGYQDATYQQPQQHNQTSYSKSSYSAYPIHHSLPQNPLASSTTTAQPYIQSQTFSSAGASSAGAVHYPVGHPKAVASKVVVPSSGEVAYPEGHPKAKAEASATYPAGARPAPYGGIQPGSGNGDAARPSYSQLVKPTVGITAPAQEEEDEKKKKKKPKTIFRAGGGEVWDDPTLLEWDTNDFRLFVGDIGNEVTEDMLNKAFSKYYSLTKTKIIRDKRTLKSRGYGFLSFSDPGDFARAYREMNGKYVGNRPIKLRKSTWKDRNIDVKSRKQLLKR